MSNYYIYRVYVKYDGFYPENTGDRSSRGKFVFNWHAYLDNLEEGDFVLVYFFGAGCRDGIFAVTKVDKIIYSRYERNVFAEILYASQDNWKPIIARKDHRELFRNTMYRPRGAEIIISAFNEAKILELLNDDVALTQQLTKLGAILPGIDLPSTFRIDSVPIVNPKSDYGWKPKRRPIIAAFWIRPRQATWIKYIKWLSYISSLFYKFKSGDRDYVTEFSQKLAEVIGSYIKTNKLHFDMMLGVPLTEFKEKQGELDRVALLCGNLSNILGIPYKKVFKLKGKISRTSYKRLGLSSGEFKSDYLANLSISRKGVREIEDSDGNILLIDDVFTDGVTTSVISKYLEETFSGMDLNIHIATLGIMAKADNVSKQLQNRWQN